MADLTREEIMAEALHRAFHDAWPGPSEPLDLYVDSPIWRGQAGALAQMLAEVWAEALREVATAIEPLRQENPMNGDGSNHALDRVLGVLDRLAGDAGPSDAAAIARKRIAEERVRDYLRLEQENASRQAALAAAEPDEGEQGAGR